MGHRMKHLRTFDQSFTIETECLLDRLLCAEAIHCRVHRLSALRRDGLLATVGDYITVCTFIAKA